jgi:hypothetical protein
LNGGFILENNNINSNKNKTMASKYYEIWDSIVDCELELIENDKIKGRILLEQLHKVVNNKLKQYK